MNSDEHSKSKQQQKISNHNGKLQMNKYFDMLSFENHGNHGKLC
jgi:hypothetical protein